MTEARRPTDYKTVLTKGITEIKNLKEKYVTYYPIGQQPSWKDRSENAVLSNISLVLRDVRKLPLPNGSGRQILETVHSAFPFKDGPELSAKGLYEILYHGSPVPPEEMGGVLRPYQSVWSDGYGRYHDHEQFAIAADDSPNFPIVRSLLNRNQPELSSVDNNNVYVLSMQGDIHGNSWLFTSETAINALEGATGYVYLFVSPTRPKKHVDEITGKMRNEYRIIEEIPLERYAFVPVTIADLPPHLFILDSGRNEIEEFFTSIGKIEPKTFLPLLKEKQIGVRTIRGDFPRQFYPGLYSK